MSTKTRCEEEAKGNSEMAYLGTLSKDHTGNTIPTWAKMIPYKKDRELQKPYPIPRHIPI